MPRPLVRRLIMGTAVFSVGAALAPGPAHALALGEVQIGSALGEALRARIPVQLAPGEVLGAACTASLAGGKSDLASLPGPVFALPEASAAGWYEIGVASARPLYEPMYELRLQLRCPGMPVLVRQYVLMIDLPGTVPAPGRARQETAPLTVTVAAPAADGARAPASTPAGPRSLPRDGAPTAPLAGGSLYRVEAGDTLSGIAMRLADRGDAGLWQVAERIFADNPDAFIAGNPDLIRLGAEIRLPSALRASQPSVSRIDPEAPAAATPVSVDAAPMQAADIAARTESATASPAPAATPQVTTAPAATVVARPTEGAGEVTADTPTHATAGTARRASPGPARPDPAAVVESRPDPASETPPWLAALVGLLVGAGASFALLRDRLVDALRGMFSGLGRAARTEIRTPAAGRVARQSSAAATGIMVVEEMHRPARFPEPIDRGTTDEMPVLKTATASRDAELGELFDAQENTGFGLDDTSRLDFDLSAAAAEASVDRDLAWLGGADAPATRPAARSRGAEASADTTAEQVDLSTLAHQAHQTHQVHRGTDDLTVSDTLRKALDLLENDYEEELTASQVLDRNEVADMLDPSGINDTLARTGTDELPRR